jgi:hypothetical protein
MTTATCQAKFQWTMGAALFGSLLAILGPLENHALAAGPGGDGIEKISLWRGKTQLRGANIWQSRMYGEIFRHQFGAEMTVGPRYTQADFDRLAQLGANWVNISHPGLFTEKAPFGLDQAVQANLDRLLDMIARADMFAVISFRTGPGRSEFTFSRDEVGDWFRTADLDESVWSHDGKQKAWAKMWRHTAQRYGQHPIVVGFDLMVEPNSDEVLGIEEPEQFYPSRAATKADWNRFYPRLVAAIRAVDAKTPILVGGMNYSSLYWLPHLVPVTADGIIYTVHQYAPYAYTHQAPKGKHAYPGHFDLDWDDRPDRFDKPWLKHLLAKSDEFTGPLAVNEFGVIRWVPGAAAFMRDSMDLFEQRGWNHALWQWYPARFPGGADYPGEFNFMYGTKARNTSEVKPNKLLDAIRTNWTRNRTRPSNTPLKTR